MNRFEITKNLHDNLRMMRHHEEQFKRYEEMLLELDSVEDVEDDKRAELSNLGLAVSKKEALEKYKEIKEKQKEKNKKKEVVEVEGKEKKVVNPKI